MFSLCIGPVIDPQNVVLDWGKRWSIYLLFLYWTSSWSSECCIRLMQSLVNIDIFLLYWTSYWSPDCCISLRQTLVSIDIGPVIGHQTAVFVRGKLLSV